MRACISRRLVPTCGRLIASLIRDKEKQARDRHTHTHIERERERERRGSKMIAV